jgi:C1A family cysteine protease
MLRFLRHSPTFVIAIGVLSYGWIEGGAVPASQIAGAGAPAAGHAAPSTVPALSATQLVSLQSTIESVTPVGVSIAVQKINRSGKARASYTKFARDALTRALIGRDRIPALSTLPPLTTTPNEQSKAIANLSEEQFGSIADFTISSLTGTTPPTDLRDRIRRQNAQAQTALQTAAPSVLAGPNLASQPSASDAKFDWRTKGLIVQDSGIVTAAKNQTTCGCCWAFATIGVVEAAFARSNLKLISGSEQYLLNESRKFLFDPANPKVTYTCDGGWWAFDMLVPRILPALASPGVPKTSDLPYSGDDPGITPAGITTPYQLVTWNYVSPANNPNEIPSDTEIKLAIVTQGPVASAIAVVDRRMWTVYDGTGVIQEFSDNQAFGANHAIVIIGWDDSRSAWIIKNSWGDGWGTSGFGYVGYQQNNIGWGAAYVVAAP